MCNLYLEIKISNFHAEFSNDILLVTIITKSNQIPELLKTKESKTNTHLDVTADDHSAVAPRLETCNKSGLLLPYKLCTITRFYEFEFGNHVLHKTL